MIKKVKYNIVQSEQLEEHIPVPFHVIGREEWLTQCIDPTAVEDWTIVRKPADLAPYTKWLNEQPELGVDSETGGDNKRDGLDPSSASSRMLIFQVGTEEKVLLVEPGLVPDLREPLENPNILKIGQNIIHDFKFSSKKYGITLVKHHYDSVLDRCVPEVYDTMLAEQLITSGIFGRSVGLEALSRRYNPYRLISKAVRKEFIDLRGTLRFRHLYYAARDVTLLFAIRREQLKAMQAFPGMWDRAQIEFCAIYGTADAELSGIVLAERVIEIIVQYQEDRAKKIEGKVIDIYDKAIKKKGKARVYLFDNVKEVFDLNSPSQKLEALQSLGFDIEDVQRETLKELGTEITDLLAEYTECTKVISTYGEGLLKRKSQTTGLLHPEFNQLGSGDIEARKGRSSATTIATGRYSSDAQQFPRPDHKNIPLEGELLKLAEHPDILAALPAALAKLAAVKQGE